MNTMKQTITLLLPFLFMYTFSSAASEQELQAVRQAIERYDLGWQAGETSVSRLDPAERKQLYGLIPEQFDPDKVVSLTTPEELPTNLDWRDKDGNWLTPITNQEMCGSCVHMATIGAVEAWYKITSGDPRTKIDLSEQFLLSCGSGSCSDGWHISAAYDFMRDMGTPSEECFPWRAWDKIPCDSVCDDWQAQIVRIPDWAAVSVGEASVWTLKSAIYNKPVTTSMAVYTSFNFYRSGVYQHTPEDSVEGWHAVVLVGWEDESQCWIAKNSWGSDWGDNGYFRIRWGDSYIGYNTAIIWDEQEGNPAMHIAPNELNLSLAPGETAFRSIEVTNIATGNLEYVTSVDINPMPKAYFHQSSFMAYDSLSWWCGDENIKGYDNHWLQYLDTPALDLTNTTVPALHFKAFWALESPLTAEPPFNGWDGCNVWVSTDGAENFTVLEPLQPPYNCSSLYSFGEEFNMGSGIAGWGGSISDWADVVCDLSSLKSNQTVLRFAFCSDPAQCTMDDPKLVGFLVDDIEVRDGEDIIFADNASYGSKMEVSGIGGRGSEWVAVHYGTGSLGAGESALINLQIQATQLADGFYQGVINIESNETSQHTTRVIPITVEVVQREFDVAVEQSLQSLRVPLSMRVQPRVLVRNRGKQDQSDFVVQCLVQKDGTQVFNDTCRVSNLSPMEASVASFNTFAAIDSGTYKLDFSLVGMTNDENPSNDYLSTQITTVNLIDDFEDISGFWDTGGTWGLSDQFGGGNTGHKMIHCNGGQHYQNNMNNSLTFVPGFDLSDQQTALLRFWARYAIESDKDFCYVEVSNDRKNWFVLETITGNKLRWHQREISLSDFTGPGNENVNIRFRFVSNESRTLIGMMLDDIEIYPGAETEVVRHGKELAIPLDFALKQNYPNPFSAGGGSAFGGNPTTTIQFNLPQATRVTLKVYNTQGREVAVLAEKYFAAGTHEVLWDASHFSSGIYLAKLTAGKFSATRKMILAK